MSARWCLLALVSTHLSAAMTLVRDGQPVAAIVVAREATPPELFAAEELQRYVQQASGARLSVGVAAPAGQPAVVVATLSHAPQLGVEPTPAEQALGSEGLARRTAGDRLLILGHWNIVLE